MTKAEETKRETANRMAPLSHVTYLSKLIGQKTKIQKKSITEAKRFLGSNIQ